MNQKCVQFPEFIYGIFEITYWNKIRTLTNIHFKFIFTAQSGIGSIFHLNDVHKVLCLGMKWLYQCIYWFKWTLAEPTMHIYWGLVKRNYKNGIFFGYLRRDICKSHTGVWFSKISCLSTWESRFCSIFGL